jgi:TonB family protein
VEADGRVGGVTVKGATHPAFVQMSLEAIGRGAFTPAMQGPLPRRSTMVYPVAFGIPGATPSAILAANHLVVVDPSAPAIPPQILMLVPPVYPAAPLLAAEGGKAVAEFTIDTEGRTGAITITETSGPEFGAALRSAIEAWAFKPAQNDAGPVAIRLRATHEFSPARVPAEERIARQLKTEGGVPGPAGLDRKLAPVWRGFPVYPQQLLDQPQAGEALVEFVIDRDGRVRVPRVISASQDGFGWAAATAVSQWVFERPTRGGQPADVRVRVPVSFKPPLK